MLLNLQSSTSPMKRVYLLSYELEINPEHMALTQALTLDQSRPGMGLNGTHGLFGSREWWDSIEQGRIPLLFLSGIIKRAYVAGQDPSRFNNSIELQLTDGSTQDIGIYVNNKKDARLFKAGSFVSIVYALDEFKPEAARNFGNKHHQITLEMAVSLEPAETK